MKVEVHYLFSKNNKIGSKVIQWGTKHQHNLEETPSHIAMLVNNRWVHESTLFTGVRVISYSKWLEINEEVAKIPCAQERDYKEVKNLFKEIKGKKYDWGGVTYLGLHLGANKFLRKEMPKHNLWEKPHRYFCCEAVAKLTGVKDYGMKSPVDLMVELSSL